MKKTFTKIMATVMAVVLLLCAVPFTASAATYSGSCGDNLTWILDTSTGTLNISGTGAMNNYTSANPPWRVSEFSYGGCIKTVNIANGVTTIGELAFVCCENLATVTIPNSVINIEEGAFVGCTSLKSISIGKNVKTIGEQAFNGCVCLKNITIPDNVISIEYGAFLDCYNLRNITIGDKVAVIEDSVFDGCSNLTDVYYKGTQNEWKNITIGSDNSSLSSANKHYNHLHSYNAVLTKAATCTKSGLYTYTCVCGDTYTETIQPKSHILEDWTVIKSATCTSTGTKVKKCISCGETIETQTIAKKSHTAGNWVITRSATCSVAGEKVKKCTACNTIVETSVIAKTAHIPSDWQIIVEPDVDTAGLMVKKCKVCSVQLDSKDIPALKLVPKIVPPSTTTINYGETLILHADLGDQTLPEGYSLQWVVVGLGVKLDPSNDGYTCKVTNSEIGGSASVWLMIYDESNEPIFDEDGELIYASVSLNSNVSFWQKIVSFFKNLFGISRIIAQFDFS